MIYEKFGIRGLNPTEDIQFLICDSLGGSIDQRFRLLSNYFGYLFIMM